MRRPPPWTAVAVNSVIRDYSEGRRLDRSRPRRAGVLDGRGGFAGSASRRQRPFARASQRGVMLSWSMVLSSRLPGLGSFAVSRPGNPGSAVLDVGPIAAFICSDLCLALHRLLRLPALIAASCMASASFVGWALGTVASAPRTPQPPRLAWGRQGSGSVRGKLVGCYWRYRRCLPLVLRSIDFAA